MRKKILSEYTVRGASEREHAQAAEQDAKLPERSALGGEHKYTRGGEARRLNLFFAPAVARALARYGLDNGLNLSRAANDLLAQALRAHQYLEPGTGASLPPHALPPRHAKA